MSGDSIQSMGGNARAKKLSVKKRKEIAQLAAAERWKFPRAICGNDTAPLKIGSLELPCYVLNNEKRVLVKSNLMSAIGISPGGSSTGKGDRLMKFVSGNRLNPFMPNDLIEQIKNPIKFITPSGGIAFGYEATLLPDLCDAVLSARQDHKLQKQQYHIAKQCEILVRGFARVGIIALVDEVTGFQKLRAKNALHEILEKFIAKDLRDWVKTFQDDFYEEMFRLRGWDYLTSLRNHRRRPILVGTLTNNIVYQRLAPFVKDELRRITPRDSKGRAKHKYFQRLTENVGYRKLQEHLAAVTALMKASDTWPEFKKSLERALPKYTQQSDLFRDN